MAGNTQGETFREIVESLRGIIGALNSKAVDIGSFAERIVKLEAEVEHLRSSLTTTNRILLSIAVALITLVIKEVASGRFLK